MSLFSHLCGDTPGRCSQLKRNPSTMTPLYKTQVFQIYLFGALSTTSRVPSSCIIFQRRQSSSLPILPKLGKSHHDSSDQGEPNSAVSGPAAIDVCVILLWCKNSIRIDVPLIDQLLEGSFISKQHFPSCKKCNAMNRVMIFLLSLFLIISFLLWRVRFNLDGSSDLDG